MRISAYERPVNLIDIANGKRSTEKAKSGEQASFKQELAAEMGGDVQFSKHAAQRLFSRGIELSRDDLNKLSAAIDKAKTKGSRETLVLTDEAAFIVSVDNKTVITAFDRDNLREGVVTSIDSAVII